jgi:hypothetical protein
MSEEKGPSGFYFQKSRPSPKDKGTPVEQALGEMRQRDYIVQVVIPSLNALGTQLDKDGVPTEVVEGALAMLQADPQLSRFSGGIGSRQPITPYELQRKEFAIQQYHSYRDYLGRNHPYVKKWMVACLVIMHNHASRGVDQDALKARPFVPWDIVPAQGKYNMQATPKKDSLET